MRQGLKAVLHRALVVVLTLAFTAAAGEAMLRLKNADQKNYLIEMWRYAKELKQISPSPEIGHVHVPGQTAVLQGVPIQINSRGMRGPEIRQNAERTILLLGSSITLGWGVAEQNTVRAQLEKLLGARYQVLNAAVGNYNTTRYVNAFKQMYRDVKPNIVVVNYFINDAEVLPPSEYNAVLKHSQFFTTLYYIFQGLIKGSESIDKLVAHYKKIYDHQGEGYREMAAALNEFNEMSRADGFSVVLAMVPDIHQLHPYPFKFIHDDIKALAASHGWTYVDFLESLGNHSGPDLYSIPGDPHPNAVAHKAMADALAGIIKDIK
jgi:lysophospholipase L1-like esterase